MKKQTSLVLAAAVLLSGVTMASAATTSHAAKAMSHAANAMSHAANAMSHAAKASDTLNLTGAEQKTAWNDLYMKSLNQTAPSGFSPAVGAAVPSGVTTAPVPRKAANAVPALKPYNFALMQNKLVIVNPSDKTIAEIISG